MSKDIDLSALENSSAPTQPIAKETKRKGKRITAAPASQSETVVQAGKQAADSMSSALSQIAVNSSNRMAQAAIAQVRQDAAVYLAVKREAETVLWQQIADAEAAEWEARFPLVEQETDIEASLANVLPDFGSINLLPVSIPDVRALLGGD